MKARELRNWCIRRPQPAVLRLTLETGDVQEVHWRKGVSWAELAESAAALAPLVVEALDAKGNLIRAMRADQVEPVRDNKSVDVPTSLSTDPETQRLCFVANLLHRAYQHSTDVAFTKLVELVERIDNRSDAIETRLERTERNYFAVLQQRIDEAFDRVEEERERARKETDEDGGVLKELVTEFAGGVAAGKASNGSG